MTTQLKLYNTLTRTKEAFTPIDANNVRMYVCGPTVYDFAHIGNARPVIVFDVLYRLLRHIYGENHVTYVRNITDVDDKINARALRDFPDLPLNEAIRKVTEKTANQFHEDVKALGCLEPTHEPRATEHIDGMVKIIQQLLDNGNAYVATGSEGREVLFAVGSMADYGKLSGRKLEDQQAGARIAVEAHKRNAGDFVLWKESAADQPGWHGAFKENGVEAPIYGRPGWHIECSAMSNAFLGETFDIHGGGLDLIFPHHENELAQSRCAHGTDVMANVWMHNGFLQVEGKKMSKSDGNFFTIDELLDSWGGSVLRLNMLKTHYRKPIDWRAEELKETDRELSNWLDLINSGPEGGLVVPDDLIFALSDDLNSAEAITVLRRFYSQAEAGRLEASLKFLGISIEIGDLDGRKHKRLRAGTGHHSLVGNDAKLTYMPSLSAKITQRLAFLASKNFAEADRIRDELLAQGIQLQDGKDPVTGERVTTWEVKR